MESGVTFLIAMVLAYTYKPLLAVLIIGWFFGSRKLVNHSLNYLQNRNYIKNFRFNILLFSFVFIAPFLPTSLKALYVEITFPNLCVGVNGYQPYNPVKLTSIKNRYTAFEYLPIEGVEFTEWEMTGKSIDNLKNFEVGKYKLQFYPNGSPQCALLADNAPKAIDEYNRRSKSYSEKGYRLRDRDGVCLGIEKIDSFSAQYKIDTILLKRSTSEYGYPVSRNNIDLIDLKTDTLISRYNHVRTYYSKPIIAYLFTDFSLNVTLRCPNGDYEPMKNVPLSSKLSTSFKTDEIMDGFFILN